jgi:hypothetical protein
MSLSTLDNTVWSKEHWIETAKYWKQSWDTAIEQRDSAIEHNKVLQAENATLYAKLEQAKLDLDDVSF